MKPAVTYSSYRIIWIEVRGELPSAEEQARAPLPITPRDDGLVRRLLEFMRVESIYRAIGAGSSGGGTYGGGFYEPDAKKIITWLRKEGCTRTKSR